MRRVNNHLSLRYNESMSDSAVLAISLDVFAALVASIMLYSNTQMYYSNIRRKKLFSQMIFLNILGLLTNACHFIPVIINHPVLELIGDSILIISFYLLEILFAEYVILSLPRIDRCVRILQIMIRTVLLSCMAVWLLAEFGILSISDKALFTFGQIPGCIGMLLIGFLILHRRKQLGRKKTVLFLLYLAFPLIGMSMRNLGILVSGQHIGIFLSILLTHSFLNSEQSHSMMEQEKLIEQNKMKIMLTQIKPHFIYNSLNTIYYLCGTDPKAAQKAVSEFSDYLRGNLDSLTTDALIPFKKELEHIHHYLYLEKLRFDDDLNIVIDTPVTDFSVPVLSIQLLVENAVKHGIGRKTGGGTVSIRTSENDEYYLITVEDDGNGFDPSQVRINGDDRSHIGLSSMRGRVTAIGGTVQIKSAPQQGTSVTVSIPKLH